ncbi:MAG: PH domain-containing protein [Lachnospiraceae bacterium]|nr:PH domain-containing protein [Lachnospiraceae bacterium]
MANQVWRARKRLKFFGLPWTFTVYTLNEDKLLIDSGFFNRKQEEIRLYRILDMTLERSFGQRIFGLGSIICNTSDQTTPVLEIKNVKKSKEVKEILSDLVEKERVSKRVSAREYMHEHGDDFDSDHDEDIDHDLP